MRIGKPPLTSCFVILVLAVIPFAGLFSADVVFTATAQPKQGEIFPVRVLSKDELVGARILSGNRSVYLRCNGMKAEGWFGFDLDVPTGNKDLTLILEKKTGTERVTKRVRVIPANFPVQHISGMPNTFVNPGEKDLDRIRQESEHLKKLWLNSDSTVYWEGDFILPFEGFKGDGFGKKRIINGEPRNPHTGVDADAKRGTPVRAINNGIVKLASELFFSGISVIIDHGGGVFSMYFHLQDRTVAAGEYVAKGGVIGHVGATGRATGPHLHLGVRLVNERVNPMDLFR